MVSKMVTKMVPHYGLRKLSVGVASVLLGTTIYGYNVAHADTLSVGNTNENENANAGGQVPYEDGNVTAENEGQVNNQANVVNDQQTFYADSLAVLNLNNNYQNVNSQQVEREVSESKVVASGNSNDPRITGKWMTTQKDTSGNAQAVEHEIKSSFQWDTWAVANSVPTIKWTTTVSPVFSKNNVPDVLELRNKYHLNHDEIFADGQSRPDYLLKDELTGNTNSEAVAVSNNMYIVATETFNNLGNSYVLRDDGSKVKIGHVDRIYFSPDGDGVVSIKKSGTYSWGPELSPNELPVVRSPFGQLATIYGDIKSIGVRNVFYDVNGNKINIPIFNDVMYIRGLHNHWGMRGTGGSTVYPGYNSGFDDDQRYVLAKGDGDDSDSAIAIGSSNSGFRYGSLNGTWSPGWGSNSGMVILDLGATYLEEVPSGKVSVEFSSYVPSNLGYKVMRTNSYRRTINLLDQNGNVIADPIIQQASWNDFSKDGNKWVSDNTFKYVDAVIPPHIDGYITNAKVIPPVQGISRDHVGNDIVNVYYVSKMASLPELDTNDAYALNPKNNMHEHKNVNDNGGFDKDYWGTVDPTCWNYSIAGDTITLENLKNVKLGDKSIIVPNIADFRAEDLDHDAKRVVISKALLSNLAFQYSRIGMSKTDNQKIGISGSSLDHTFANSSVEVMDLHNLDISNVQTLSYFAFGTSNLRTIGDISGWNTSNVTDMKNMFASANSLIDLGDIGNWDVSNVTDMSAMFSNTRALRNVGNLDSWNVSSVIAMNGMFRDAHSLTYIGNLSGWNVGKVQNMDGIFSGASGLRSLDISNWNLMTLSSYFSFNNMFDRDPYLCLIDNNVKLPSYYSGLLTNPDIFSDHMAVITDNDQLLKSTGNTDDYTIDGQKFTRSIFYQSNGSSDAVTVIKAANQKLMDSYTAKHPDKLLKYDSSQNMTDPIALANASFVTVPNNVDTMITFVISDSHLVGSDLVLNGPSQTKIDPNDVKIPDGYILDGSLPDMYYGNHYTIKLKRKQIPITDVSELNATITVTYKFNVIDKYASDPRFKTQTQILHFKRTGYVDGVTGQKVFTDWQATDSAKAVTVPKLTGYDWDTGSSRDKEGHYTSSLDPKDVNAVALDFVRDKNGNDSITYSINAVPEHCNQEIDFVDSDGNNHTMTVVEAFYDTVLNVNEHMPEMPDGWRIVPGQNIPKTVTMSFNGKPIKIRIEHIVNPVKPGEHGVPAQAFEANPKRTIIFNVPGEYADKPQYKKIVQTVHFTRNITYDEVTKQVIYGPWKEKGNFSEVNVPELAGYKTSMSVISEMAVTGDTKDITISVGYVAEKQSQLINYVDAATGKTIHQQMVNGVTDQTVNVASEVPANWVLANGQTFPTSITLANNPSPLTVKITHVINPANPSPDGPFPAGTQKSDWYRTVKHIVNFEVPSKYADNPLYKQIVQTINFSRKGQIDAVTGKITYFDWQQDNKFMNVTVPALSGYTPSETTVIAPVVNADSKDIITNVTYTPNQQSQLINYVDTATGKTIHQQMVNGVTDQTVNVVSEVPANWKLANGQTFPTSITLANNSSPLTVKITHQINWLNPPVHGPYPFSTLQSDWYRTVRHIINFKVPSKYADNPLYKQIVQTINFSRKGEVDAVTGKITYFDWQQDNKFINVTVPGLDGYTPSQTTVIAPVVNADSKDVVINVTYMADPSSVRISYVDNDNREISHQDFSGVTDQDVKISAQLPANWKLASGQQVPEVITLLARPRTIQVVVEHIVNNVQPGENGPWPGNTQKSDWYRTVTRTISFKVPDKYSSQSQFKTIVQTVNFKRSGHLDTVINKVTFDAWQRTGQFDVVKVPSLTGYTTNYVTVDHVVPGADDQNSVVDVIYTPKAESQLINYVDANGQVIHRQKVDGKMDDTIKVIPDIPAHWKLSQGVSVPGTITLTDQPAALSYQIEHIIDNLTPSENGPYPHGTKKSDWYRTVTRTINFTVPDKYGKEPQFKTITQMVNFKRTGHYDQALDKVSFDPWQRAGQFDAVKVPQLFGYTTSTDQVVGEVPTENSSNQTVNVTYVPQTATLQINFVTPDGQPVSYVDDKGVFDTVIDLGINWRNDLPSGYQMYDRNIDQDLGSLPVDFLTKTINVVVVPTQTMKMQTKTVTRRIHLQMPNGTEQVVTQSAVFTRQLTMQAGSKDPVEVGAWSPDAWLVAYQPSHLDGYTIDNVKSVLVSGDSNDQDVYLKYRAIAQPTTVTFALINGQIVDSVKVDDLKTAQVSNLVPKGYHLLNSEDGASRLLVEPDMVTYNGNMSNVPSNVGELKRTVKRTIIMVLANGRTRRIVQQVRFTRTATVNQATGEIMYGDWHAVGSSKFNRINVPKRAGRTIRILGGNVNAVAVNANMHDSVVRVRYI